MRYELYVFNMKCANTLHVGTYDSLKAAYIALPDDNEYSMFIIIVNSKNSIITWGYEAGYLKNGYAGIACITRISDTRWQTVNNLLNEICLIKLANRLAAGEVTYGIHWDSNNFTEIPSVSNNFIKWIDRILNYRSENNIVLRYRV